MMMLIKKNLSLIKVTILMRNYIQNKMKLNEMAQGINGLDQERLDKHTRKMGDTGTS